MPGLIQLLLAATLLAAAPLAAATSDCPPRRGPFRGVYQGLLYTGMPDLRVHGIRPVHIIDRGFWTDEGKPGTPDRAKLDALVARLPRDGAPIVIDIEFLPLNRANPAMAANVTTLARIAAWFKAAAPDRMVGYYGLYPLSDYWRALDVPPGGKRDWQRDNDAASALRSHVDWTFPSLYTYYRDTDGWVRQARALVCEARRIAGKPVYVFVWPEFHDSTSDAGKPVPPEYWRLQLETLHTIADGIVLWGGYDLQAGRPRAWDDREPWWHVTKQMLREWNLPPASPR